MRTTAVEGMMPDRGAQNHGKPATLNRWECCFVRSKLWGLCHRTLLRTMKSIWPQIASTRCCFQSAMNTGGGLEIYPRRRFQQRLL